LERPRPIRGSVPDHSLIFMPTTNKLTSHRAASLERQAWIAKLKREIKSAAEAAGAGAVLGKLLKWGEARVRRFDRKKGGLGK